MTGTQLRAIRLRLGLTLAQFGRALGYRGSTVSISSRLSGMEGGARTITEQVARLAEMYGRYGVPQQYLEQPKGMSRRKRP